MKQFIICAVAAALLHCNMISYRHRDSKPHPIDNIILQDVFDFWIGEGICIEAVYIFPDYDNPPYNRYQFIREGEADPYYRRER